MKRAAAVALVLCLVVASAPAYAFVDYLFGGSSNAGAIDNSAVGDFRAWWTGNPGYQFNPWWSGPSKNPASQQPGQAGAPDGSLGGQPVDPGVNPPAMNYHSGQAGQMPYGGGAPAGYQQPYAAAPPNYPPPQAYQPPQGYAAPPQPQQLPQQAYQGPPPGYRQPPPQQQFYNGENGMYGGAGFVPGQSTR
jgi:hypothetical protein